MGRARRTRPREGAPVPFERLAAHAVGCEQEPPALLGPGSRIAQGPPTSQRADSAPSTFSRARTSDSGST